MELAGLASRAAGFRGALGLAFPVVAGEVSETAWQLQYRADAKVLGAVGAVLVQAELPTVEVRLPRHLAEQAITAWEREGDEGRPDPETFEQRVQRHRAATLALIGLSIVNAGRWENDEVVVELSPIFVGVAVDASDDLSSR